MLPSLRTHKEYIQFVDVNLKDVPIPKAHKDVPLKLLDLTPLRILFLPLYCLTFGRVGFAPEDLIRTFIAMVLWGITSPTDWVNDYLSDESGFYTVISGFLPENVPSVGCLYDFLRRILSIPKYCREKHIRKKGSDSLTNKRNNLKMTKRKSPNDMLKLSPNSLKVFQELQPTKKKSMYKNMNKW